MILNEIYQISFNTSCFNVITLTNGLHVKLDSLQVPHPHSCSTYQSLAAVNGGRVGVINSWLSKGTCRWAEAGVPIGEIFYDS